MQYNNKKHTKKEKKMSLVLLILSVIALTANIIIAIIAKASFLVILLSILPYILTICLLFEIRSDTKKINRLEELLHKKGIITYDEVYRPQDDAIYTKPYTPVAKQTDSSVCPHCNATITKDSKTCPNCLMPIDFKKNGKKNK